MQQPSSVVSRHSRRAFSSRFIGAFALLTGLVGSSAATAAAPSPVVFSVVSATDLGVQVAQYSGNTRTATSAISGTLIGQAPGFRASAWVVSPASGVKLVAVVGSASTQLLPGSAQTFIGDSQLFEDGAVKSDETSAEYRQFASFSDPASAITVSVPTPGQGFTRDLVATAAAGTRLCAAAVDYSTTTTAPQIGDGTLWCKDGQGTLKRAWSSTDSYFLDLAFAPGSSTQGAAVVVAPTSADPAAPLAASTRSFTVGQDGNVTLGAADVAVPLPDDVGAVQLEWGTRQGSPSPLLALFSGNDVSVFDHGTALITVASSTYVGISARAADFAPTQAAANRATVTITVTGVPAKAVAFGAKTTVTAVATVTAFGTSWTVPVTGAFAATAAKSNCVQFASAETIWTQAASSKSCILVSHKVAPSISKKGRVLTVLTTASTLLVEQMPTKKGKKPVVINKALKVVKGKATLTLKQPGQYRVTAAKTASNELFAALITVK